MSKLKRTWLFWLVVFLIPLLCLVSIGLFQNKIGIELVNDESNLYFNIEYIESILISVATSMLAAGIVYLFIDKKLRELLAHDEVITVILKSDSGKEKECPPMSRKDFSRQEVLGYLGMLGGPERFKLSYMKTPEFGKRILEIQQSKGNEQLVILCSDDEYNQFSSDYHEDDDITIVIRSKTHPEIKTECPPMSRKNFCRAEVLGYVGMYSNVTPFQIAYLKNPQFLTDLLSLSKSKGKQEFIIECSDSEMEQFTMINKCKQ